jgi:hypothetical protein
LKKEVRIKEVNYFGSDELIIVLTKIEDIRGNVEVDDDDEDEEEEDMEVEVDKLEGGESGSQNLGDRTCRQCNKVFHKPSQLGRVK